MWRSSVILGVVVGDDGCCVSLCVVNVLVALQALRWFGWSWGMGGVVDGGGGKEEAAWQCLSPTCRIWEDRC